jgi:Tol biopolymer transport system component/DNA-binding winged helix-turn-helix (wHTH) protein
MSLEIKSFEFGEYSLDVEEKVLFRHGLPLAVTPKVFQLLLVLVKNHGRLLEKEELIKTIWADSFVEEVNLPFTVSILRKTLGDDKQNPRFIETVSRRGYRFIAEVREIGKAQNISQTHAVGFKKFLFPAAALLIIGLISIGFWSAFSKNRESSAPILSAPFSSEKFSKSGKVRHAAISPDGNFVAFVDEIGGKQSIWLRKLETSENIQIVQSGDEFYHGMVFSHDGQTVYFVRTPVMQPPRSVIYRVSVFGGVPEKIIEFTEGWISLSPDDKQISFVRCQYKDDDYCSLMIADADGRNERKLVTRPHPIRLGDNQFSPDGKSIAFASSNSGNGGSDFRLLKFDLTSGAETEISPETFFNIKSLKWLPDGNNLLIAALDQLNGRAKIHRISAVTGKVETLTNDAANYLGISLNKDASRMIAIEYGNNFQVYLSDGAATKLLVAAHEVAFGVDGTLIFAADDNDLWTIGQNGGEQRQLTNNQFKDYVPIPSPDGRFIYFTSNRTGSNQVWRMNTDGSNQIQITKKEGGYPIFVTADGTRIYYESGLHETLWKVSADGSEESVVFGKKVFRPVISPDGSLLAYFSREKDERVKISVMTLADLKELKTLEFAQPKALPVRIAWSPDNKTVNYITFYESKNSLWQQSLDEAKPSIIKGLGDKSVGYFSLSPDGSKYAYTRGEWLHNAVLLKGLK